MGLYGVVVDTQGSVVKDVFPVVSPESMQEEEGKKVELSDPKLLKLDNILLAAWLQNEKTVNFVGMDNGNEIIGEVKKSKILETKSDEVDEISIVRLINNDVVMVWSLL